MRKQKGEGDKKKDLEHKWSHSDLLTYITEHTSDFSSNWGEQAKQQ